MVEELEGFLGRGATPDELTELCERHRERVRVQLDGVELPKTVNLERVESGEGDYRDAGRRGGARVTFAKPPFGFSDATRTRAQKVLLVAMVVTFCSLVIAWLAPSIRGQLYLVATLGGVVLVGAALITARVRLPVRQLVLEEGRDELEVHLLGGETVGVPVAAARLRRTDLTKQRGGAYLYLLGPGLDVRLVSAFLTVEAGRLVAARLEAALRLSGPGPAKKS